MEQLITNIRIWLNIKQAHPECDNVITLNENDANNILKMYEQLKTKS